MRNILAIDGGGIRGIIPALVLAEIEARAGRPVAEMFDLIAGTSTGGILALGFGLPDSHKQPMTAQDLSRLYETRGSEIFPSSFWRKFSTLGFITDEKYPHDGLEKVMREYFQDARYCDANTRLLVTSYDLLERQPVFFKSWQARWGDVLMRDIARATSAAPTYFEPLGMTVQGQAMALIDGGVFVNNPAMSAYVEAKRLFPEERRFRILSLGTGEFTNPIKLKDAKEWGKAAWIQPLLDCMFDGVSDSVDYQLRQLLPKDYIRLQLPLAKGTQSMDDTRQQNITSLKKQAAKLIQDNDAVIEQIANWRHKAEKPLLPDAGVSAIV
jgi:hypothetical protein